MAALRQRQSRCIRALGTLLPAGNTGPPSCRPAGSPRISLTWRSRTTSPSSCCSWRHRASHVSTTATPSSRLQPLRQRARQAGHTWPEVGRQSDGTQPCGFSCAQLPATAQSAGSHLPLLASGPGRSPVRRRAGAAWRGRAARRRAGRPPRAPRRTVWQPGGAAPRAPSAPPAGRSWPAGGAGGGRCRRGGWAGALSQSNRHPCSQAKPAADLPNSLPCEPHLVRCQPRQLHVVQHLQGARRIQLVLLGSVGHGGGPRRQGISAEGDTMPAGEAPCGARPAAA